MACLSPSPKEHDVSCLVRPHAGNTVQREPAPRELSPAPPLRDRLPTEARHPRRIRGRRPTGARPMDCRRTSATSEAHDQPVQFRRCLNTPIFFLGLGPLRPRRLHRSIKLVEHRGFRAFTVMGHTNAILSARNWRHPDVAVWGLPIDHDQKFQQTTNLQYAFDKGRGAWAGSRGDTTPAWWPARSRTMRQRSPRRGPAGRHRNVLRFHVRHTRSADHRLRPEPGRQAAENSCRRHRG